MHARKTLHTRTRGSILLVTVIMGTGMALALGSFISIAVESTKLSNRSFYSNSVLNLAEAGVEEAIWALNKNDWTGWSVHTSGTMNRTRTVSSINLGQGTRGQTKVVVYGATGVPNPRVVAEGRATPVIGPAIEKQIEVRLGRRSKWANGIVAKDQVRFSGGVTEIDSYLSSVGYDAAHPRDNGSAASVSVATDAVSLSNAKVWGRVATGGSPPVVGPNGEIRGYDTQAGVKVDPDRISNDFYADLEPPPIPSTTTGIILGNISGPYTFIGSSDPNAPTRFVVSNLDNKSHEVTKILGYAELVVTNEIEIRGSFVVGGTDAATGLGIPSAVEIHAEGDVDVAGNGLMNMTGRPENLIIFGRSTPGNQLITLGGNGAVQAAVYAPLTEVVLNGGGTGGVWFGSVVGRTVTINGNYDFHYDEDLQNKTDGNPFAVSRWLELVTAAQRVEL